MVPNRFLFSSFKASRLQRGIPFSLFSVFLPLFPKEERNPLTRTTYSLQLQQSRKKGNSLEKGVEKARPLLVLLLCFFV